MVAKAVKHCAIGDVFQMVVSGVTGNNSPVMNSMFTGLCAR